MMIRKYRDEDINLINELGKKLHDNYYFNKTKFVDAFVVEEDKFIGFITYSVIYDRAEIIDIIITEEERKKGYASMLVNAVINEALSKDLENITLEVNCNNEAAINLYKKLGFEVASIRKNYYKDNDGYLMIKDLR